MAEYNILGTDLKIIDDEMDGKDLTVVVSVRGKQDIDSVSGVDNLVQALNLRLNARKGALSELGHPDYGSRLYTLIGELNNSGNRKLLEAYTRQCLRQEPRVREIIGITVETSPTEPGAVFVHASVLPIESQEPLNLVFPFHFEG
jgi:phage baseplate assembly protein W